jgi:hypothetical protein
MFALPVMIALLAAQPFAAEDEVSPLLRGFRAGGGGLAILDVDGIAPTAEAGLELVPSDRLSVRLMAGAAVRVGWGAFYLAPDVAFRPLQREGGFVPYVAAGLHVGVLNLEHAVDQDSAVARAAVGGVSGPGDGGGAPLAAGAAPAGPSPLAFTVGPQATAGFELQVTEAMRVDVGLRYTMLRWDGDFYNALGLVLTFLGPAR